MDVAVWRDMSLLWLIFLTLVAVLPVGVVLFFAVKGMHRLRQLVLRFFPVVQEKAQQVAEAADRLSHKAVSPIISVRARAAQVQGMGKAITRRKQA